MIIDILLALKALLMGAIEGATEFLPISSTGHLIIVGDFLQFWSVDKRNVFEIIIQLAAILAVCWHFRRKLISTLRALIDGGTERASARQLIIKLGLAFLPAAMLGIAFHRIIKDYLFSPTTVALALILGGLAILYIERQNLAATASHVEAITYSQAWKIGWAQTLALIPGVSRAGATILGGVVFGLNRATATEFSFFLAIPIMFSATAYELLKNASLLEASDVKVFAFGFIAAFLTALWVIRYLLRFVSTHDFKVFAYYRIGLGVLVFCYDWH